MKFKYTLGLCSGCSNKVIFAGDRILKIDQRPGECLICGGWSTPPIPLGDLGMKYEQ